MQNVSMWMFGSVLTLKLTCVISVGLTSSVIACVHYPYVALVSLYGSSLLPCSGVQNLLALGFF